MAIIRGLPSQLGSRGAVGSRVTILGAQKAIAKLEEAKRYTQLELGFLTAATAAKMEVRAKANVPVITGNLRSGIKSEHAGPYTWSVTASSRDGSVAEKNKKEYAGFVEFGARSIVPPRYFMTRAWRETYPDAAVGLKRIASGLMRL